jgi:endoglucanase
VFRLVKKNVVHRLLIWTIAAPLIWCEVHCNDPRTNRVFAYADIRTETTSKPRLVSSDANDESGIAMQPDEDAVVDRDPESDPFFQNARLGRGVNLANCLEAPREGEWGVVLNESYFQLIEEAGFNSVRIPIRWSAHADEEQPYTIDSDFFNRVDWAIEQSLLRNLVVVIDIQKYDELMLTPQSDKERFLALWDQIASHYRFHSERLFFEILSEPSQNLTPEVWNDYLAETITVIRKNNPSRILIIDTALWGDIVSLDDLQIPEGDLNIITTIHYYRPFEFTHQGAEWISGSDAWLNTPWEGTPSDVQAVSDDFNAVLSWSKKHHRPIFIGELGAYSRADLASRIRWTEYVARQAETKGFSWAYWEFGAGFGVYNPMQRDWNYSLLNVLIP